MRRKIKLWYWIGFALLLTGCLESFELPVQEGNIRFLVVDGFLNTANGEVTVSLLRATRITESDTPLEENATVALEDSDGNSYLLNDLGSGNYNLPGLPLNFEKQYRIYVRTTDGKEYRSLFTTPKKTPEITDVGWNAESNGLQITVDTEDPAGDTRYYRWTFEETWEYHSVYSSDWMLVDAVAEPRPPDEQIHICYQTTPSTKIYTTSTSGFTQDRVNDFELAFLPKGTEKLSYRYSVLVRQYAISEEAYNYFERLKKTSQNLGGLFDPQPSKVTGNISNIADPSEIVLGYFDAIEAKEKRMFVTLRDLPDHLRTVDRSMTCFIDTVKVEDLGLFATATSNLLVGQITEALQIVGYTHTTRSCADCRMKGGVVSKPDFWP